MPCNTAAAGQSWAGASGSVHFWSREPGRRLASAGAGAASVALASDASYHLPSKCLELRAQVWNEQLHLNCSTPCVWGKNTRNFIFRRINNFLVLPLKSRSGTNFQHFAADSEAPLSFWSLPRGKHEPFSRRRSKKVLSVVGALYQLLPAKVSRWGEKWPC